MAAFEFTGRIHAHRTEVFDVFTDIANTPERIPAIEQVELLTDQATGAGTRRKETRQMFGKSHAETLEITEYDAPNSYTVGCESCGARCASTYSFRQEGEHTLVTCRVRTTPITLYAS